MAVSKLRQDYRILQDLQDLSCESCLMNDHYHLALAAAIELAEKDALPATEQ